MLGKAQITGSGVVSLFCLVGHLDYSVMDLP